MKINENGKSVFFRPVKGLIQFFDAADKWFPVAEDKVWHRDPDGLHSHAFYGYKITLCNVF